MRASAMQKKSLVINVIMSFGVLVLLGGAEPNIAVRKVTAKNTTHYRTASVTVQCDNRSAKDRWYGVPGSGYLENEIVSALKALGIARSFDERQSDLIVTCHYQNGWCLPYTGRHWDVFFSSIHTVNIKLIAKGTNEVIGEVEYRRPRFTTRPPEGFVATMFSEMIGKNVVDSTNAPSATE